jgi:hypothetical protein
MKLVRFLFICRPKSFKVYLNLINLCFAFFSFGLARACFLIGLVFFVLFCFSFVFCFFFFGGGGGGLGRYCETKMAVN